MKKMQVSHQANGNRFGITTGLGMGQFFVKMMEDQKAKKLSDEAIAAVLQKEFPNGAAHYEDNIRLYRSMYNNGKWGCQLKKAPDFPVMKYVNGKPKIRHSGPKADRE